MKRIFVYLLALALLFALCACSNHAESPAQQREEQLGEQRQADSGSEPADDPRQKEAMAPFVGTWVLECPVVDPAPFELQESGVFVSGNSTGHWSVDTASGKLVIDGTAWLVFEEDGFTKIRPDQTYTSMYEPETCTRVMEKNRSAAAEKKFVVVDLSEENILDYVGQPVLAGNRLDNQGNITNACYLYPSLVYDRGLVFFASGDDLCWECTDGNMSISYGDCPYLYDSCQNELTGTAWGRLCYIRADYVTDNRLELIDGFSYRVLTLTSGEKYLCGGNRGTVDYDYQDYLY
jgi:hypothetical protein